MVFNISDYGAIADGALCTVAIQRAIDACFLAGGGEVVIPEGRYLVGGLRLRSGVTLHLLENAVLMGSIDPEDYTGYINDPIEPISEKERTAYVPTARQGATLGDSARPCSRWNNAIIRAFRANNIAIIGERGSEINGQNCFDEQGEEHYRGPHAINMWYCENITLRGYTIRDSANWAHAIQNSQNIDIREVKVLGGHDGFDVRTCDDIRIEYCKFMTGDDCIAGFDNRNVTVCNCYFESSCSMFRFGATNMLVEGCTGVAPATYGFRGHLSDEEKRRRAATTEQCRHSCHGVFLYYCDDRAEVRSTPGGILIRNCKFKNPDAILTLPFGHKWCCNRSLADITFEDCRFEGICMPIRSTCPEDEPLTLNMKNCYVSAREGYEEIPFMTGKNVKAVRLENVCFENLTNAEILCDTDGKGRGCTEIGIYQANGKTRLSL
ncbi:MAG: right-handed parallel beta-helix repeat-containing protein [Clostridia bacterium]|nr:right-handed parallel beta-helix repeat-containing protein [Clostridia bacterium]